MTEQRLKFVEHQFRARFSTEEFKYKTLEGVENADEFLEQWTLEHERRASILPRNKFVRWPYEQSVYRTTIRDIMRESLHKDLGLARVWFWIANHPQLQGHSQDPGPKLEKYDKDSFIRREAQDIVEWFWAAERLALIRMHKGTYPVEDILRSRKIVEARGNDANKLVRPSTAVSMSNLARFRIRRYFEERDGGLFSNYWLVHGAAMTTPNIRNKILALMATFHRGVDDELIPFLPMKKKRAMEITLSQECTKSAHSSIRAYLNTLAKINGKIKIECRAQDRKLHFPLEKIKDDLKTPVVELARHERVRLSSEEVSKYVDEFGGIVDRFNDKFHKLPVIDQFASIIHNDPIPQNAAENFLVDRLISARQNLIKLSKAPKIIEVDCFSIEMTKVWTVLEDRAHTVIMKCSRQIRESFHDSVATLQQEFAKFKKVLNFRSMDPTTMLKNKAEVLDIVQFDMPRVVASLVEAYDRMHSLTQEIQFNPSEHDYLINVALTRRALPRHIADHNMFFHRRLHIFTHFVRVREDTVRQAARSAMNELKVVSGFIDPQRVDQYLIQMRALKPKVMDLLAELKELNDQETVVGFPLLHLPELVDLGEQVGVLWTLFEWCKRFHEFKADFFKRRRTEVRVVDCQNFVDSFFEMLGQVGPRIETQKTAKAFSVQLKAEMEKFRHHIPVLEVMSCPRLTERHWQKMSDIVGFNLEQYANATVAQISELNLNLYVSKLKPIAFIAEREGAIADQANYITDYWIEASFEMERTLFWDIHIPVNLAMLVSAAEDHSVKIRAYKDPDDKSYTNQSLDKWTDDLAQLLVILKKWHRALESWKRVAGVMQHSSQNIPGEFEHFRMCAKRLARFVDEERFAIKIIEGKHINCWLDLGASHLQQVVAGMRAFFAHLTSANPRMSLMSDGDLLKLLSVNDVGEGLKVLKRECFPYLREMTEAEGRVTAVTIEGERIKLSALITPDVLLQSGPQVFTATVENAFKRIILKDYVKFTHHRSLMRAMLRLTHVVNNLLLHTTSESGVNASFTHQWAQGKVPLLSGTLTEIRGRVQSYARAFLTAVRFLNCHRNLNVNVFEKVAKSCTDGSVLFVYENVDHLSEQQLTRLLHSIRGIEKECPRLILCTTSPSQAQRLSNHISVFHHLTEEERKERGLTVIRSRRRRSSVQPAQEVVKETAKVTGKGPEEVLNDGIFGPEAVHYSMAQANFAIVCAGPCAKEALADCLAKNNARSTWVYVDALVDEQLIRVQQEFGESSGGYLIRSLKEIMRANEEREEKDSSTASKQPESELRSASDSATASTHVGTAGTAGTVETANTDSRRQSVSCRHPKYVVFYGSRSLAQHFPQVCSLFYSHSNAVLPEMPPGSYLTLADGSNFYAAKNIRFVLCLPHLNKNTVEWFKRLDIRILNLPPKAKKSIEAEWSAFKEQLDRILKRNEFMDVVISAVELLLLPIITKFEFVETFSFDTFLWFLSSDLGSAYSQVTTANYGELLRAVTVHSGFNYLVLHLKGGLAEVNKFLDAKTTEWDKNSADLGRLPTPFGEYRLSLTDPNGYWIKWATNLHLKSLISKELSTSEIFVNYVSIDRLLHVSIELFSSSDKHFVFSGPDLCGKSTAIKRLATHLEQTQEGYRFVWMDCTERFDLSAIQKRFAGIANDKKVCLIIDHFHFEEACTALVELYNDHSMLVSMDQPQICTSHFRFIVITNTTEFEKCRRFGLFHNNFEHIPMKPPTLDEVHYIFEQILCWNFKTKTFSSDYFQLAPKFSNASGKLYKLMGKDDNQLLPYAVRLAKAMMFSFPDNTPDLDSIMRLWCHETIRLLLDREYTRERRQMFLNSFDAVVNASLGTSVAHLFPSIKAEDEDEDDGFYGKKDGALQMPDFRLEALLFSEMSGLETIDGINYQIVVRRSEFNKTLENLHFEYVRNNEGFNINLVMTDDHVQRVMRVARQHNEHLALAGLPGSGRTQCSKLGAFGVQGQVFHVFLETHSAATFEESWKRTLLRVIHILSSGNHPVLVLFHMDYCLDKLPREWMVMLKQWLQRPMVSNLLSDTVVIKMAEKMIESEKTMATLVQSSNLRLPGQRYCQFLDFEAFKNVDLLRTTIEARISDFLHAVFLIPPEFVDQFEWCTVDCVMPTGKNECRRILEAQVAECRAENKTRLRETIETLYQFTKDMLATKQGFNCFKLYSDSKLLHEVTRLTVLNFNDKYDKVQKQIQRLNNALSTTSRIRELSIIGSHSTVPELFKKKYNQILVYDFLVKINEEHKEFREKLLEEKRTIQKDIQQLETKLEQKRTKVSSVLKDPQTNLKEAKTEVYQFGRADFKSLANLKQPSLALRLAIEYTRKMLDEKYRPDRNWTEAWKESSKVIVKKSFQDKLIDFDPISMTGPHLKEVLKLTDGKETKTGKLQLEHPLAAAIGNWLNASLTVAKVNKSMWSQKKQADQLSKGIAAKNEQLNALEADLEYVDMRLEALAKDLQRESAAVVKVNRMICYRQHGEMVINSLGGLQNRWKALVSSTRSRLDNLLGNSLFVASFKTLLCCLEGETKNSVIGRWRSATLRYNLTFEEKYASVQMLFVDYLRWREMWPLISTKRPEVVNMIQLFFNDCNSVDMSAGNWTDPEVADKVVRASYSDQTLLLYNIKQCPPTSWFELFLREPDKEKRTADLLGKTILFSDNFKLVMITEMELTLIDSQFLRLVTPLRLTEPFEIKDTHGSATLVSAEEDLLKLLTDFNAIDILESEEVTNQIIQALESIPTSNS